MEGDCAAALIPAESGKRGRHCGSHPVHTIARQGGRLGGAQHARNQAHIRVCADSSVGLEANQQNGGQRQNQGSHMGAIALCIWVETFLRSGGRSCRVYLLHPKAKRQQAGPPRHSPTCENAQQNISRLWPSSNSCTDTQGKKKERSRKRRSSHTSNPSPWFAASTT